jgi:hypothetical protein
MADSEEAMVEPERIYNSSNAIVHVDGEHIRISEVGPRGGFKMMEFQRYVFRAIMGAYFRRYPEEFPGFVELAGLKKFLETGPRAVNLDG